MLKKRIIPKLLMRKKQIGAIARNVLVNTTRFGSDSYVGTPLSQAKIFDANLADELIFLDIDSRGPGDPEVVHALRSAAEEIFVPLTIGGGVKSIADFRILLQNGADKISINTAAIMRPAFIAEAASEFGSQCVVVSIDYKISSVGRLEVYAGGGRLATGLDPLKWAEEAARLGAGEILLTSIDRDGTRMGLDLDTLAAVVSSVSVPVIASGGCGNTTHFIEGFKKGGADAVASGTFFSFKDEPPMQARAHIKNAGIPIRIPTATHSSY